MKFKTTIRTATALAVACSAGLCLTACNKIEGDPNRILSAEEAAKVWSDHRKRMDFANTGTMIALGVLVGIKLIDLALTLKDRKRK